MVEDAVGALPVIADRDLGRGILSKQHAKLSSQLLLHVCSVVPDRHAPDQGSVSLV